MIPALVDDCDQTSVFIRLQPAAKPGVRKAELGEVPQRQCVWIRWDVDIPGTVNFIVCLILVFGRLFEMAGAGSVHFWGEARGCCYLAVALHFGTVHAIRLPFVQRD